MPLDLAVLVDRLRSTGFKVDTRQYLLAHELLLTVARRGGQLASAERLISHLGPIFCTCAEEQERFGLEIRQWLGPTQPLYHDPRTRPVPAVRSRQRVTFTVVAWTAAILVLAFSVAHLVRQVRSPAEPSPEPPSPIDRLLTPTASADEPPTAWGMVAAGAVFVSGLAYGSGWLAERLRRQLALRRLPTYDDPERVTLTLPEVRVSLIPDLVVRRAAAALTRPREGTLLDVDIEATVDETARAGGFFTPCFSARRSIQEYVAIVSRRGAGDHQAAVFDTFLKQLRDRGVAVEAYSFHDDPRVCYSDESGHARRLGEIVQRHHKATFLVCADARVAFNAATGTIAPWVGATAALERRVFWSPEAPYRWSRFEFELIESGFIVIPTSEDGWRALVDLDNGWRQDALYPAPYARAFPSLIGASERRWLDRNEPPPEIAAKLVRQLSDFLGPAGFDWLCACAVYPEITWGLTLRVAGEAIDYSALPSLARLPWFRQAFMPDWLRRLLVARLSPDAGERLRADLAGLLDDLVRTSADGSGGAATRSALRIARWMQSIRTIDVLRAAPAGSPLRDHVFLGFMARATVDPLGLSVPQPLSRLFGAQVGRFTPAVDRSDGVSLRRRLSARFRGWMVFHTRQLRIIQSCALGLVLLMVWRPAQDTVSEAIIANAPLVASIPTPLPGAVPDAQPMTPTGAPAPPAISPPPTGRQIATPRPPPERGAIEKRTGPPVAAPVEAGRRDQQQTGGAVDPSVPNVGGGVNDPMPAAGAVVGAASPPGGRGTPAASESAAAAGDRSRGAGVASTPPDTIVAIQQLIATYASAMESLNPSAVADVYPNVNTRALADAFREYTSLDEDIKINRIDVAPDGQKATVNAVLTITQVVKIGRASPVTRTVVFALRRQGDRWLIEGIK